jgi:hypothetical protein
MKCILKMKSGNIIEFDREDMATLDGYQIIENYEIVQGTIIVQLDKLKLTSKGTEIIIPLFEIEYILTTLTKRGNG